MSPLPSYSSSFTWLPGYCLCCGLPSQRELDLCTCCEQALPRLGESCTICAQPLALAGICGHCQTTPPAYDKILSPFLYESPVRELVLSLKQGNLAAGRVLGTITAREITDQYVDKPLPDLLLPAPLHWRRRWQRGFNQAVVIANHITQRVNVPVATNLLARTTFHSSQQQLSRGQRMGNLRNAFTARQSLGGLFIAVVDDVVTTGATANAVAATAKKAGAAKVEIWSVARTPLEK